MICGLLVLFTCQLVGTVAANALDLPVPGPVIGMILFLVVLQVRRPAPESGTVRAADGLLRHLSLLFIPAGVGVMANLTIIRQHWVPITASFFASWLAGLVVAAAAGAATAALVRTAAPRPPDGRVAEDPTSAESDAW